MNQTLKEQIEAALEPVSEYRPYADREHPGNKIRPCVRCVGCGKLGCITYWGPWCFDCNVERIDRINKAFAPIAALTAAHCDDDKSSVEQNNP